MLSELELFDCELLPCSGPKATKWQGVPRRDGTPALAVLVTSFFLSCVTAFKRKGLLPAIVCEFQEMCKRGDRCRYLHNEVRPVAPPQCRSFAKGEDCPWGAKCKFTHA